MKKYNLLIVAFLLSTLAFGQPPRPNKKMREQIEAEKIAFISSEVELTADEAKLFWPIYNKYEAEIKVVRKQRRTYFEELKNEDNLSGDRAYELMELIFKSEQTEGKIRSTYLNKFSSVLGKKKAALVFISEEKFKHKLLDRLRENHPRN
jgi:site-specific DNA-adenine methylase